MYVKKEVNFSFHTAIDANKVDSLRDLFPSECRWWEKVRYLLNRKFQSFSGGIADVKTSIYTSQ